LTESEYPDVKGIALSPVYADQWRGSVIRPDSDLPVARAARSRKSIHIEDLREDPSYLGGKPLTARNSENRERPLRRQRRRYGARHSCGTSDADL